MITIRQAKVEDATAIAKVHVQAWQESYINLLPQTYLDGLLSTLEGRINNWKKTLTNSNRWTWVAEDTSGVLGFVIFGPPRDENRTGFVELGAIYILNKIKRKGIGFKLLQIGFDQMKEKGFDRCYCWVLEGNPTVNFYQRTGGRIGSLTKTDEICGKPYKELMIEWDSLNIDFNPG